MAASAMAWPAALIPRKIDFHPENQSRSGGLSITGSEQITVSASGRWRATATMTIRGEASNLALRQLVAAMEGRAGTILVPKWERYRPRDANGREVSPVATIGYECGQFNFDVSGFGQSDAVHAQVAASASVGSTQVSLNLVDGEGPRPGHYFGIGDRLYRCASVWQEDEGDPTQVRFWPRLRAAVAAETTAILDRPVCLMRFADDGQGEAALNHAGSGVVTLEFVEAI